LVAVLDLMVGACQPLHGREIADQKFNYWC
jgi:hypothetical protein